jgi:hypothetical protein
MTGHRPQISLDSNASGFLLIKTALHLHVEQMHVLCLLTQIVSGAHATLQVHTITWQQEVDLSFIFSFFQLQ